MMFQEIMIAIQFEVNIYNQNRDLIKHCQSKGLVVAVYAPLGAYNRLGKS